MSLRAAFQTVRCRGVSCTPSGKVTVVSRTSASARAFASSVVFWGTVTVDFEGRRGARMMLFGGDVDRRAERQLIAPFEAQEMPSSSSTRIRAQKRSRISPGVRFGGEDEGSACGFAHTRWAM